MKNRAQRFLTALFRPHKRKDSRSSGLLYLEPLEGRTLPTAGYTPIHLVDPNSSDATGPTALLPNGNIVVAVSDDTVNGIANAGGVYLYASSTGALISALTGSHSGDMVGGNGITVLSDGNFLVASPSWNGGIGAVTWVNGFTGATAVVSATNSLVGSASTDAVGAKAPVLLPNGNFVIVDPSWHGGDGAVTWGNGVTGTAGIVSSTNSFVGDPAKNNGTDSDQVGSLGAVSLSNGNYVISSPNWNHEVGAVTWGNGVSGSSGVVSAANSLVGSDPGDQVGGNEFGTVSGVVSLKNGNYVVISPFWNDQRGAVTWADGSESIAAVVSSTNSLVGTTPNDFVGANVNGAQDFLVLGNGNCVILSPNWNGAIGASTLVNGAIGTFGAVSATNSLVGSSAGDSVGSGGVTALTNGNFVIASGSWNNRAGAITWGDGVTGTVGVVTAANSLVGNPGDGVGIPTALANGNYVVVSSSWNNQAGAVTWGNGLGGTTGLISATNSLVGNAGDMLGARNATPLANGNYVVANPFWNHSSGAVTWGNGAGGTTGLVSAANSLVGGFGDSIGFFGTIPLPNGNYVVGSPDFNSGAGAVTWGNGLRGTVGFVSAANSLVGKPGDTGGLGVFVLPNGNYLVDDSLWNGGAGAVTWGNGAIGTSGIVSAVNSLVGARSTDANQDDGDQVGSNVFILPNGNYVLDSFNWNKDMGAVTWGDGSRGLIGQVSSNNSLVGSRPGDLVGATAGIGAFGVGLTVLSNGDYVVTSTMWNSGSGALTIGEGTEPVTGQVSSGNSFIGILAAGGNAVGVQGLGGGNFVTANTSIFDNHGIGGFSSSNPIFYKPFTTAPQFVSPNLAMFTLGAPNSFTVKVAGVGTPILSVAESLPPSLSFDPATGVLTTTESNLPVGAYYLTFTASDGHGNSTTQNFTLVIQSPIVPAVQAYITAVYQGVLGRAPDAAGLGYWTGQFNAGLARSALVNFIDHSGEFYAGIIKSAYSRFLGRAADSGALVFWTSQMSGGLRDETFEAALIGSPEYYQHSGGTDKTWVDVMYQDLLGRLADSGGESAWVQALAAGAPHGLVASTFALSIEREGQHVMALYLDLLGRTPVASEVNFWVGQLGAGMSLQDMVTVFASSGEFVQKHS